MVKVVITASCPEKVSRLQAKLALYDAGLLAEAEYLVNNTSDISIQLAWNEAVEFRRDSPTINVLASQLGLSPAQVDQLFIDASSITL